MQDTAWDMEDLIPVVAVLSDRYTSMDSSSVTYETARMLMGAVVYCLREWKSQEGDLPAAKTEGVRMDFQPMYQLGYERVLEKVRRAKAVYEELMADFEDYGCQNYGDTILKGMPEFFANYEPKFCPQDHLLTLDYPVLSVLGNRCGVDRILDYLLGVQMEVGFMKRFNKDRVVNVLRGIQPDYRALYLDNLCAPVLMRAVGCAIAGKSVLELELDGADYEMIDAQFRGDEKGVVEEKLRRVIEALAAALPEEEFSGAVQYFGGVARDYAVRLLNAGSVRCL